MCVFNFVGVYIYEVCIYVWNNIYMCAIYTHVLCIYMYKGCIYMSTYMGRCV